MKIWHISDTHGYHEELIVPDGIDMVIHSGDASNYRDKYRNELEFRRFLDWFGNIDIEHKVYVAGNHDSAIEKGLIRIDDFNQNMIHYIENTENVIAGIKIWGSPHCPTFGDWSFMKAREKLYPLWQIVPNDVDILVTHTPPQGILDYSFDRHGNLERCGCKSLMDRVKNIEPKLHLFGHIHNSANLHNAGMMTIQGMKTVFSNGSVVTDGRFGKKLSHGNIIDYE